MHFHFYRLTILHSFAVKIPIECAKSCLVYGSSYATANCGSGILLVSHHRLATHSVHGFSEEPYYVEGEMIDRLKANVSLKLVLLFRAAQYL